MSMPWWGREAPDSTKPFLQGGDPLLQPPGRDGVLAELRARIEGYTPEWSGALNGDAGAALLQLFSELEEPILERLNRMPEKALVEFLRAAEVLPLAPRPARALLVFETVPAAPASVLIPAGFQVSGTGSGGGTVVFETEDQLYAAAAKVEAVFSVQAGQTLAIDPSAAGEAGVEALGPRPEAEDTLLIGLSGDVLPAPGLNLALILGAELPPPHASSRASNPARPLLRWEAYDNGFVELEVVRDETSGLTSSGVVEFNTPPTWQSGTPPGVKADQPLRWLRLRLVHGSFAEAPRLAAVHLNAVHASAMRTLYEEVPEYVPGSARSRLRLSQTPVLPDSLSLSVDEGGAAEPVTWTEVASLADRGPEERVYVLDPETGELSFGDGVQGAALPPGFRHVVARSYSVGGGSIGNLDADKITTLVSSMPFLLRVSNPYPSGGGQDAESAQRTYRLGPQRIRARDRAVTKADYALLALESAGAELTRAHAISGFHPDYPGARLPGVVTLFLLGRRRADAPPWPSEADLAATSAYLAEQVAAVGSEIVCAAPKFHTVGVRLTLVPEPGIDPGALVRATLTELDRYLDPLHGGEDGEGWPFGGELRQQRLVLTLLERVPGLTAVTRVNLIIDGIVRATCTDFSPDDNALLWPDAHELRLESGGAL